MVSMKRSDLNEAVRAMKTEQSSFHQTMKEIDEFSEHILRYKSFIGFIELKGDLQLFRMSLNSIFVRKVSDYRHLSNHNIEVHSNATKYCRDLQQKIYNDLAKVLYGEMGMIACLGRARSLR